MACDKTDVSNTILDDLPSLLSAPETIAMIDRAARIFVLLVSTIVLPVSNVVAQTASPPKVERIASVEGVTEYRLANGLRAVLVPDQSKSTTTVNMTYLAGSRQESYGETGMAHLIEHLVSYGST